MSEENNNKNFNQNEFEKAYAEWIQRQDAAREEMRREQQRQQAEHVRIVTEMNARAAEVQQDINTRRLRQYAAIVAVDLYGGFSKAGEIPWYYPEDFKFFKETTAGHVCVMGRTTYDDINKRLGEKAAISVLPGRTCFVVTSRPLDRNNATAVKSIGEVDLELDRRDVPIDKTVFFIGGEMIYREGIAKCDTVYMTVVNKEAECDKFFPRNSLQKYFTTAEVKSGENSDLRFITWRRMG